MCRTSSHSRLFGPWAYGSISQALEHPLGLTLPAIILVADEAQGFGEAGENCDTSSETLSLDGVPVDPEMSC